MLWKIANILNNRDQKEKTSYDVSVYPENNAAHEYAMFDI